MPKKKAAKKPAERQPMSRGRRIITPWDSPGGIGDLQRNDPLKLFDTAIGEGWNGMGVNQLAAIRAMRQLTTLSTVVQSYLKNSATNIIGDVAPKPTFSQLENGDLLNKNDIGKQAIARLREAWDEFSYDCTVNGGVDLQVYLAAMLRTLLVDGRALSIMRRSDSYPGLVGLMPIERDWLYFSENGAAATIRFDEGEAYNGVIRNDAGRITHYVFFGDPNPQEVIKEQQRGGNMFLTGYRRAKPRVVPASQVIDLRNMQGAADFDASPSFLIPAMRELRNVAEYDRATLGAMKNAATMMLILEREMDSPSYTKTEETDPDAMPNPTRIRANRIEETLPGRKVSNWKPASPSYDQSEFKKGLLKQAVASLGTDYASVCGDMKEVNFSSIRAGIVQSRDHFRVMQALLDRQVLRPALKMLIDTLILRGEVKMSQKAYKLALRTEYRWRGHQNIDPVKDATADSMAVALGIESPQRLAEKRGVEFEAVMQDLEKAAEKAKALGLAAPYLLPPTPEPVDIPEDEEKEFEQEEKNDNT